VMERALVRILHGFRDVGIPVETYMVREEALEELRKLHPQMFDDQGKLHLHLRVHVGCRFLQPMGILPPHHFQVRHEDPLRG
jgi:hypothetical protein